jgi:putative ABC transport system permease protein
VEDFHYSNLKTKIEPGYIAFNDDGRNLLVKAKSNSLVQANEAISKVWSDMIPDYPLNIETIADRYSSMHSENKNYIYLIGSCSVISIFLSMIGLFAISYQDSRIRIKEIGVRKVNGANVNEILALLNRDYVKWIIIAFVIACPVTWYFIHQWLEHFAYRTGLSWWIFALAGFLALCISLITVSWQSWMAARRNPVEALRYE